jgi:hypothetical protein
MFFTFVKMDGTEKGVVENEEVNPRCELSVLHDCQQNLQLHSPLQFHQALADTVP